MTDLERREQLVFSSENTNNNVAVFGSRATTGTMTFSDDPNVIQGIDNNGTNWNNGWSSAVLNGNSPLMEDFNAISYVNSYNLAYLLQKGIAEWSENTTYFKGNIYMIINTEDFKPNLYYSYTDNNKGNNPVEDEEGINWRQLQLGGGSGAPVGTLIKSTIPLKEANLHLADGSQLAYNGVYKEFYDYMNNLKATTPNIFCTEEEYNNSITTYGNCGKYVLVENQYIRLPTINGWIENITDINNNGVSNEAGLPNITGTFQGTRSGASADYAAPSGAFRRITPGLDTYNTGGADCYNTQFNASYSNSIYGKSTEVTPKGIKYLVYIVLGTIIKTDIEIDINQIANDINLVAGETSKNSNNIIPLQKRYLIESYTNNQGNWYNKYNDGWCEQGAKLPNTGGADIVINLLVPFKDTNYFIVKNAGSAHTDRPAYQSVSCYNLTTTSFAHTSNTTQVYARWFACGYYK